MAPLDIGALTARAALSELEISPVHGALVDLLTLAEAVWCEACLREDRRERRERTLVSRPQFSPDELLAMRLLEALGTPEAPAPDLIRRIGEQIAARARAA